MYFRDSKVISKAEYKRLVDQTIELYRLKNKVTDMEKAEQILKSKMIRMENLLKEKAGENQRLQNMINFHEREVAKLKNKCSEQNKDVRN